jgi:nucleoside-diphosphate-sugar epimerase
MYNITGKEKKVKFIEKQKGDVDITYSNTEKAKNILGYHPLVYIDDGLKKTYNWQINHEPY